jgi:molybdenum cofactor cytidylyltransferase
MIAGLLLAAGGARRFGSQKLIEPLDGAPLVRQAAARLVSTVDATYVVVGHEAEHVAAAVTDLGLTVVANEAWMEGLSSSLRAGVAALPDDCEAVVVALGDQPLMGLQAVSVVIERWRETRKPIVVTRYDGTRGHPILFARSMWPALAELRGDTGARDLIEQSRAQVAYVDVDSPMPADVDTGADLERLRAGIDGMG